MDFKKQLIGKSAELKERENGLRFSVCDGNGVQKAAFVVRFNTKAYAYFNSCAHLPVELDWKPGLFFDSDKEYLVCSTHGALYRADTGRCVAGPCAGSKLEPVAIFEDKGDIYFFDQKNKL